MGDRMKESILTLSIVLLFAFTGQAMTRNVASFKAAKNAAARIDSLIRDGATDTACQEVDRLMSILASARPALTEAQQALLWDKYPWFAGIACAWSFAHEWQGNDCLYQCGTVDQCQKGGQE